MLSALKGHIKKSRSEAAGWAGATWLEKNWEKVRLLFEKEALGKYVFEPIAELWEQSDPSSDAAISRIWRSVQR